MPGPKHGPKHEPYAEPRLPIKEGSMTRSEYVRRIAVGARRLAAVADAVDINSFASWQHYLDHLDDFWSFTNTWPRHDDTRYATDTPDANVPRRKRR
jgi:hypothetical protein